ncbi:MAG: hypothetical protein EOP56_08155 [Sphingobacteriales bacterium]|nr:MAG: hypothetical protein EOP56_08155 [Sphingobacteriales bacterium]
MITLCTWYALGIPAMLSLTALIALYERDYLHADTLRIKDCMRLSLISWLLVPMAIVWLCIRWRKI